MIAVVCLPPNRVPLRVFDEVAETVSCGLRALAATGQGLSDRTVFLGAHVLPWSRYTDDRAIFYNFEQRGSPALSSSVLDMFRRHEVWDYSPSNIAWFAEHGIRAKHVPIGYVPDLTRIEKAPTKDIDVLFYGLVNDRRRRILDSLRATGLAVCVLSNCYGTERDRLIARSKIVLNTHFYDAGIFEMVRCSYLFANEVCVVSEDSIDVPPELTRALPFAPRDELADTCAALARDAESRTSWASLSHRAFRTCNEVDILREAVNGSRP